MADGDGIRRNISRVSQTERDRLRDAIMELNQRAYPGSRDDLPENPIMPGWVTPGGVSKWYKQDEIHQATHVHGGPAFLTWHRELCNRFERLLREIDPLVSLHYWDWTTDPRNLFTPNFMGTANGPAGEPWLSAGFYDPTADPFRSDFVDPDRDPSLPPLPNSNPFDPPRRLERRVGQNPSVTNPDGSPNLRVSDADIISAETFPEMRNLLERAHNAAHSYIGGTLANPHLSFRDPFVFLLHSNVDRLFAIWQLQPGKEWRLDPEQVYGSESDTVADGRNVGILTPLEPWAGIDAPDIEDGVRPARPWAPPEDEQLMKENQKNSKHISVVTPPPYDNTKENRGT